MSDPRAVPTLDELEGDPEKAATLGADTIEALLVRCLALQTRLFARLIALPAAENGASDRFLDVDQVAAAIAKSKTWIEHNTKDLPPRRKVGGEKLWSERELQAWMKHRPTK